MFRWFLEFVPLPLISSVQLKSGLPGSREVSSPQVVLNDFAVKMVANDSPICAEFVLHSPTPESSTANELQLINRFSAPPSVWSAALRIPAQFGTPAGKQVWITRENSFISRQRRISA